MYPRYLLCSFRRRLFASAINSRQFASVTGVTLPLCFSGHSTPAEFLTTKVRLKRELKVSLLIPPARASSRLVISVIKFSSISYILSIVIVLVTRYCQTSTG